MQYVKSVFICISAGDSPVRKRRKLWKYNTSISGEVSEENKENCCVIS